MIYQTGKQKMNQQLNCCPKLKYKKKKNQEICWLASRPNYVKLHMVSRHLITQQQMGIPESDLWT